MVYTHRSLNVPKLLLYVKVDRKMCAPTIVLYQCCHPQTKYLKNPSMIGYITMWNARACYQNISMVSELKYQQNLQFMT